ncbi:MAG: hypothetical protein Q4D38_15100, partial [Planctomycetia bacterium]|nr:hypothetical protein [Planctomycetia bacterium]
LNYELRPSFSAQENPEREKFFEGTLSHGMGLTMTLRGGGFKRKNSNMKYYRAIISQKIRLCGVFLWCLDLTHSVFLL